MLNSLILFGDLSTGAIAYHPSVESSSRRIELSFDSIKNSLHLQILQLQYLPLHCEIQFPLH